MTHPKNNSLTSNKKQAASKTIHDAQELIKNYICLYLTMAVNKMSWNNNKLNFM